MNQLFRKKPVVIEATQWFKNGDHPLDYAKSHYGLENGVLREFPGDERKANGWEGDIVRYYRDPQLDGQSTCQHCGKIMHVHGWIETLEGGHIVCPGDWIITGIKGEFYPCKPDIFAATYEDVDASAVPDASPVPTDVAEFLAEPFELNMSNYDQNDVDRLQRWALRAYDLLAAAPAAHVSEQVEA